jgi:hypothetical protein
LSQFHVSQIETHVRDRYSDRHWVSPLRDVANLSRLLALHAVNIALGSSDSDEGRVIEITDGADDRGIDCVGIDPTAKVVVFVQSKWRQDGSGSMTLEDILKFLDGVRSLLGMRSGIDLVHASDTTRNAVHELLRTPGGKVRLITATTASEPLSPAVEQPIQELLSQLNDLEGTNPIAMHTHLTQADFFNSLSEAPRLQVDIQIQILDWGRATEPVKAFYGRVNASEIAHWYQEHGASLFAENIRVVIPRSDINDGILNTILTEPERFVYYNNGITVLSESIEVGAGGLLNREVGFFSLLRASIVNGAQTVSTLGSVLGTESEANLGRAYVLVRCIEVPAVNPGLGQSITRFANTQNEVSSQDFAFLDAQQHRLVKELRVLGYEYILRSAEIPNSQDPSVVIDLRQAAIALACANHNISHAVTAKREVSRLFSESVYRTLFNPRTEPLRLLRAVLVMREVDRVLDQIVATTSGVGAGVAVHGRRVIAHRLLRQLDDSTLADPAHYIESANIENQVRDMLQQLVDVFPDNAYPGNVFKNQTRINELLGAIDSR